MSEGGEPNPSATLALICVLIVAQLVVPPLLYVWGRAVAGRRASEPRWRWVSRLPLVGLAISLLGYAIPALTCVGSFAIADAAGRATALARGISNAMNVGALTLAISVVLWVGSTIALAYGAFARPAR